jgi:choline dehydrogenase-like flavoprotein
MNPQGPESVDAVIVGSGAGGAAAAHRLAADGLQVVVLEKGGRLPKDGSTLDVERVVQRGEFLSREPWRDGQGRPISPEEHFNLGGKTKWYGAALLRYGADEFGPEPSYGCAGWPFPADEITSFYGQAEDLLGVRAFDCEPSLARILAALERAGHGWEATPLPMALSARILGDRREATHFDGFASVADLKADAENALLRRLEGRPNVRVLTDAAVEGLVADPDDPTRIAGVRLADGREFRGRAVLLAAGALHSPRLLARHLRRHGLADRLPAVGRNLKLHLLTAMVAITPFVQGDLLRKTVVLTHPRYPHSSVQPLGFDGELLGTLFPRVVPRALAREIGRRAYGFFLQTEDPSHPDNRVLDGDDAGGPPVLDYDARRTPAALGEHRRFVFGLQRSLLSAGLLGFTRRIGLNGTAHASGTLSAGTDPANSVVDAAGRVHGFEGLYVVDGSALTRSSRVNPSLTIFAWSLRVAGQLAARLTTDRCRTQPGTATARPALSASA